MMLIGMKLQQIFLSRRSNHLQLIFFRHHPILFRLFQRFIPVA